MIWKNKKTLGSWLGGYERVRDWNIKTQKFCKKRVRKFTLARIPTKGVKKSVTLYFSSHEAAKKAGWRW